MRALDRSHGHPHAQVGTGDRVHTCEAGTPPRAAFGVRAVGATLVNGGGTMNNAKSLFIFLAGLMCVGGVIGLVATWSLSGMLFGFIAPSVFALPIILSSAFRIGGRGLL